MRGAECGKVSLFEIDGAIFDRGKLCFADNSDRPRAGEMYRILNEHWDYAKADLNYKSVVRRRVKSKLQLIKHKKRTEFISVLFLCFFEKVKKSILFLYQFACQNFMFMIKLTSVKN